MKNLRPLVFHLFVVTALSLLVFVTAQQVIRQLGYFPEDTLAHDLGAALATGKDPSLLVPDRDEDVGSLQSPFLVVYNDKMEAVASTGLLNGARPRPPIGTFDKARTTGENRFTWQPDPDHRFAVVMLRFEGTGASGYVLGARSLLGTERLIILIGKLVLTAWFLIVVVLSVGCCLVIPREIARQ